MITKEEIDRKSEELGIHAANVQRDYVFGWLLSGLFHPENPLGQQLILKGGNCFRKAYFEHGRFSNDLDFSTQTEIAEENLRTSLRQACAVAGERSGIEFLPDENRVSIKDLAGEESTIYEARVYFKSFYGEEDLTIKVKLDIKEFDKIFLPIQKRRLIHAYSDSEVCRADLQCHKLEELLASKLVALLQRQHSPDLFDFVFSVFFQKALDVRRLEIITTFLNKTIYEPNPEAAKGLLLDLPFQVIRGLWNQYLVCPKQSLFTFDDAENWFRSSIENLFSLLEPRFGKVWGHGAGLSFFGAKYRDLIMEAGRLKRLLKLVYDGYERKIEPYSLAYKRRQDNVAREYFYAWDLSGGRSRQIGIKSFTAEKVRSIQLTEETFEPRYPIELTKDEGSGYFAKPFSARTRSHFSSSRRSNSSGLVYMVECPYCGKKFKRSSYDTKLNEHKDKDGYRCYGRVGTIFY